MSDLTDILKRIDPGEEMEAAFAVARRASEGKRLKADDVAAAIEELVDAVLNMRRVAHDWFAVVERNCEECIYRKDDLDDQPVAEAVVKLERENDGLRDEVERLKKVRAHD